MYYKAVPINVPWDNSYNDTILSNYSDISVYFNAVHDVNIKAGTAQLINISSLTELTSSIIYDFSNDDPFLYNYICIVNGADIKGYFINNIEYVSQNRYRLALENDVMINYFNSADLGMGIIDRCHLPQWEKVDNNIIPLKEALENGNINEDSHAEPVYLKNRTALTPNMVEDTNHTTFYAIYATSKGRKHGSFSGDGEMKNDTCLLSPTNIILPYAIYIMPTEELRVKTPSYNMIWGGQYALDSIISWLGGEAEMYSLKIIQLPSNHLQKLIRDETLNVDNDENLFILEPDFAMRLDYTEHSSTGYLVGTMIIAGGTTDFVPTEKITPKLEFTLKEFTTAGRKIEHELKFLGSQFSKLELSYKGNTYDYALNKIGYPRINNLKFILSQGMTADITSKYLRLKIDPNDGYGIADYTEKTDENYYGLVTSTDDMLVYSVNALNTYLASNKNFYTQRNAQSTFDTIKAGNNIVGSAMSLNVGGITKGVNSLLDVANARLQSNWTLDNMKNAPEIIKGTNADFSLDLFINKGYFMLSYYELLPVDKAILFDYFTMYGYKVNTLKNIKEVCKYRKYFNYVKAEINNINLPVPNAIKNKIKNIFARGIRFWVYRENEELQFGNFELNNYEISLDN